MSVTKRGNRWMARVALKGERLAAFADTEIEAKILEGQLLAKLSSQGNSVRVWTLGEAFDKAVETRWKNSKSLRTVHKNGKLILEHFGKDLPCDQVDREALEEWAEALEDLGNSNATINRKLACLSVILQTANAYGGQFAHPPLKLFTRKEGVGRLRWLSPEEESAALAWFRQWYSDGADLFVVLIDTGMRFGEATSAVTARDVDFKTGLVAVWVNKTDLPRSIPMTERVKEVYLRWTKVNPTGPVMPVAHSVFLLRWRRMAAVLGLQADKQFVPHVLRHTCMSRLAQAGVPLAALQAWGGWTNYNMVMRYAHLSPRHLTTHVGALEEYSKGIKSPGSVRSG